MTARAAASTPAAGAPPARRVTQQRAPDERHDQQAEQPAHELNVQPHVSIQHVTELVRDDALQLVAAQRIERALRDGHRGIRRRVPGGERVDRSSPVRARRPRGIGTPDAIAISSTTL